jgi:hypothetical protein
MWVNVTTSMKKNAQVWAELSDDKCPHHMYKVSHMFCFLTLLSLMTKYRHSCSERELEKMLAKVENELKRLRDAKEEARDVHEKKESSKDMVAPWKKVNQGPLHHSTILSTLLSVNQLVAKAYHPSVGR